MSGALWRHPVALGLVALLLAILAAATFAIVPETQQAVILRLDRPIAVINGADAGGSGAGLIARIPFLDRLVWIDKRLITVDTDGQSLATADGQRLDVTADAVVRVAQPMRLITAARNEQGAGETLRALLEASTRDEMARHSLAGLLGPDRAAIRQGILTRFAGAARPLGVAVTDVRLRRTELSGPSQDQALARMRDAREREANAIRVESRREVAGIEARANADEAQVYARSFGQDAQAYDFYRAMQSYTSVFGGGDKGSTNFVLSPSNPYLRQFEGRGDEPARASAR